MTHSLIGKEVTVTTCNDKSFRGLLVEYDYTIIKLEEASMVGQYLKLANPIYIPVSAIVTMMEESN